MARNEAALELIQLGADKAIVAGGFGSPLHVAAAHGNASTVKVMLKAGCPMDVVAIAAVPVFCMLQL